MIINYNIDNIYKLDILISRIIFDILLAYSI